MNRPLLFSLLVMATLTACAGNATPSATPITDAGGAAVALIQQQMFSNLTQQAIDNQRVQEGAKMTATQQVRDATATQSAHEEAVRMTQRADSATQQAWKVTVAAAQAADAATAQAKIDEKTATAEYHATATQGAMIVATERANNGATATSDYKTQQAPIEDAKKKALDIETKKAELELKRAQDTYWLSAYGGWFFALLVAIAAGFVIWKKSQFGVVLDENGKVRIVMIGKRALLPELMVNPVADFSSKDKVTVPDLGVNAETQSRQAHERNVVDAIAALPQGYPRQAVGLAGGMMGQPGGAQINIQVLSADRMNPVLDEAEGGLLEG
jgi:hypothetical protein